MSSSRWIACCHRRLVQHQEAQQQHFTPQKLQRAMGTATDTRRGSGRSDGSPTFVRSLATHNQSYPHHSTPMSKPSAQHNLLNGSSGPKASQPIYPNGSISTSYQTPPRRPNGHHQHQRNSHHHHHQHHLATTSTTPIINSSTPLQTTSTNSSPVSANSAVLFELGRKSSSSSASSNNSFTLVGDRFGGTGVVNTSMKHYYHRPRDDSSIGMLPHGPPPPPRPSIENTITIISPLDGLLINCQTTEDSNCAQISPELNVIAVSNEYWVAFYSIKSNECLGTLQFPGHCRHWTWIKADTVAVITEEKVFHWSLAGGIGNGGGESVGCGAFLREIFDIDAEIADNQITDYATDPLFGNWCALSTLYVDDDGKTCCFFFANSNFISFR